MIQATLTDGRYIWEILTATGLKPTREITQTEWKALLYRTYSNDAVCPVCERTNGENRWVTLTRRYQVLPINAVRTPVTIDYIYCDCGLTAARVPRFPGAREKFYFASQTFIAPTE